ncbi:DUF308 domain-containing protein [Tropicimonas sediminicola]|uniref:Uncharacterized membrane protein HdeD, DUF308 family n=1 Tax=Tropicimonas sediminicola TaxID=1031541 RepID=A0A239CEL2_9RHOB|nr:DUF308 domain-containing protein [Tropicimonas sediminicola]SNS17904.1 Uncharacterized membrane protein HdeD, DUF308 family [Tropicimonas sediminicola]
MSEWARWLLLGCLSILFGALALANAVAVSFGITIVTGSLLILAGLIQVGIGFKDDGGLNKAISIMLGLLVAVLGLSFVRNPFEGMMSLTLVITLFIGAAGVLRLFWAFQMRQTRFFWMMLLSGSLSILLAGFIFANFEQASARLLGILLGIELLFNGLALVVLALFLRTRLDNL